MKKIFFMITFISLFLLCGCANCNSCNKPQPNNFEISFVVDGELYLSDTVVFGKTIEKPVIEEKQGYVFKGWYITEDYVQEWNFEEPVTSSVTLYGYWVETEMETFNVVFVDDSIPIHTEKVLKGSCTEKFEPEEKDGYVFSYWEYNGQAFDFSSPVYSDITLTAVWTAIEYKVTFTADGQVVAEESFTANNLLVNIPDLPEKEHYTGKWETFIYELKDIEVQAIYTPIPYTATFYVDGDIYRKITYTVEDEIDIPDIPSKIGYTGLWDGPPITGGNVTINVVYTPIDYKITYKIGGDVVDTRTYNVESKDVTPPDIPEIPGYVGLWEEIELDTGDKTVNGYYALKELHAYFYVDETIYATRTFTVENKDIDVPDVPFKEGYTGLWKSYNLGSEDITISAIYVKDIYTATFKIDDKIIDVIEFTTDTITINEPTIPEQYQKDGYTAQWESYTLGSHDITVNIEYVPIKYNAEFVIDGHVIDSYEFTLENETLTEPPIPDIFQKDGYAVCWEHYTINSGNISIKAIYTPITYTAKFVIDGQIIDESKFTVEDTYINEPEIANKYQKNGYLARWEDYSITAGDIVVNIEYILITYYASFIYGDTVIEKVPYTINDKVIKEPEPPQREGYIAVWKNYTIPYEDFEIELQYFEIKQNETVGHLIFELSEDKKSYCLKEYDVDINSPLGTPELKVVIPPEVNHIPVTAIAERAFSSRKNFNEVIIPDSVTEIGSYAFNRTNIVSIKLPSNLTHIRNIFVGCTSLESVIIPSSVKYIDANAFAFCSSLKTVYFEDCNNWHLYNDNNCQEEIRNEPMQSNLSEIVSNPATIAKYLTADYQEYYWKKEIV